ncbi:Uncharacterised protein [Mycobacteroides abscessus subsp. abscessus]|nr:Uncharacterised protein [Mycobacteroides abscessus subsp. abscessus]
MYYLTPHFHSFKNKKPKQNEPRNGFKSVQVMPKRGNIPLNDIDFYIKLLNLLMFVNAYIFDLFEFIEI